MTLRELKISEIKAKGWIYKFLERQASGLTGNMDKIGFPFIEKYWENDKNIKMNDGANFLGGLNSVDDSWTPFEQNGYWIDGMIRTARLTGNEKLIEKAKAKIYPIIENADKDGYLGPNFLKDGMEWAHTVYFRALIAEYSATGDKKILDALAKHFLRRPLKDVFMRHSDLRIITVRDIVSIEIVLWLYGETHDSRFLNSAEEAYEEFNRIYSDDSKAKPNEEMFDLTLEGMLGNRKVCRNHGVTYCEICKLAAILYYYTGKEIYKKAAVKAFDKVYRDQMLIDGVISSTEYLNGNTDSWAMHETCDISDFTWAIGYLFMITGDARYGDWIENAIFNAGFGAVDGDFKANQYFSCPNQVISDDQSNHVYFYRGSDWNSYAPEKLLACCAGNVHRFMPNYLARSWMTDGENLIAFTYAPSEINVKVKSVKVKIEEITEYPFNNTVFFRISTESATRFILRLRVPQWSQKTILQINGNEIEYKVDKGFISVDREFINGDEIKIEFTDEIELIKNAHGVSVKKGALLYALSVKEKKEINGLRELGNPDYPHYSLYADSKWNYALCSEEKACFKAVSGDLGTEPWRLSDNGNRIKANAREIIGWSLKSMKNGKRRIHARGKGVPIGKPIKITPKVTKLKPTDKLGQSEEIELVPYATTCLRIAIFPETNYKA